MGTKCAVCGVTGVDALFYGPEGDLYCSRHRPDEGDELREEVARLRAALVEAVAEGWYYRSEDRAYIYSWAETDDHIRDDYRMKARKSLALDGLVPLDH